MSNCHGSNDPPLRASVLLSVCINIYICASNRTEFLSWSANSLSVPSYLTPSVFRLSEDSQIFPTLPFLLPSGERHQIEN